MIPLLSAILVLAVQAAPIKADHITVDIAAATKGEKGEAVVLQHEVWVGANNQVTKRRITRESSKGFVELTAIEMADVDLAKLDSSPVKWSDPKLQDDMRAVGFKIEKLGTEEINAIKCIKYDITFPADIEDRSYDALTFWEPENPRLRAAFPFVKQYTYVIKDGKRTLKEASIVLIRSGR